MQPKMIAVFLISMAVAMTPAFAVDTPADVTVQDTIGLTAEGDLAWALQANAQNSDIQNVLITSISNVPINVLVTTPGFSPSGLATNNLHLDGFGALSTTPTVATSNLAVNDDVQEPFFMNVNIGTPSGSYHADLTWTAVAS